MGCGRRTEKVTKTDIAKRRKNITLEIKFGSSVYVFGIDKIVSDRNRFGQIVTNLMSNGALALVRFCERSP